MNAPFVSRASPHATGELSIRRSSSATRAFTMLEILVVLAIIGLLATLAIVNLGGTHDRASETAARLMVEDSFKTALETYRLYEGSYPSTAEGLQALRTAPAARADRWRGPYVQKVPVDPWGEPYRYESPGKHNPRSYDVWSAGRDRVSGTDDDIGNWEKTTASPP